MPNIEITHESYGLAAISRSGWAVEAFFDARLELRPDLPIPSSEELLLSAVAAPLPLADEPLYMRPLMMALRKSVRRDLGSGAGVRVSFATRSSLCRRRMYRCNARTLESTGLLGLGSGTA